MPGPSIPLMRVCAVNGTNSACSSRQVAAAEVEFLLGEHDDGAALRRFVGERGELRRIGELGFRHAAESAGIRSPGDCRA